MLMKLTHSQNIALFFGIMDCVFLVPLIPAGLISIPFLLYFGLFSFLSLFSKEFFFFGIVFFTICFALIAFIFFGIHLMLEYFKHYKNYLTKKEVDRLWAKTIIYNSILFFPSFYIHLQCWVTGNCLLKGNYNNELRLLSEYSYFFPLLTLWWFLAIFLAFSALASIEESTYSNNP